MLCCAARAGVVYSMGLVSEATQTEISLRTEDVVQLITQGSWEAVSSARNRPVAGTPPALLLQHSHCCWDAGCAGLHLPVVLHVPQATSKRSDLLEFIQLESGVATLFDVRRNESYDAGKTVDALLSSAEVRNWMRATNQVGPYIRLLQTQQCYPTLQCGGVRLHWWCNSVMCVVDVLACTKRCSTTSTPTLSTVCAVPC